MYLQHNEHRYHVKLKIAFCSVLGLETVICESHPNIQSWIKLEVSILEHQITNTWHTAGLTAAIFRPGWILPGIYGFQQQHKCN